MDGLWTVLVLIGVSLVVAYCGPDDPPDGWDARGWRQFSERQDKRRES